MLFQRVAGSLAAFASLAAAVNLTGYEYIVIGSGAGGGPLAARLALAGHSTLLIEAGDDQGANINYTVPAYNARVSEDPNLAWNFFVKHYADEKRQARDFKTSYDTPDGSVYTGLSPPAGSKMKGTLYPRTASLGGCTAHNALIAVYPHQSDFENIATLTGDSSWSAANMRKYFVRLENNHYLLPNASTGHGFSGWLDTSYAPLDVVVADPQLLSLVGGAATALSNETNLVINLDTLLAGDANADTKTRDTTPALYQIPLSTADGKRTGSREFVLAVAGATNADGSKKYPLDVRLNCHVTKLTFDTTVSPPRATGVEFLDGAYLYRASPQSTGARGTRGTARASREVVVAAGTYNSPQLLKLSGIGPAAELRRFGIPVLVDLPGVGTNLQDHYETAVQARVPAPFSALAGCTFDASASDACLARWRASSGAGNRGIYASPGLGASMFFPSSTSERGEYDAFVFGGPVNFRGYFPGYSANATAAHDVFTWAILKAHPRNTAGSVTLRSADPLDVPTIVYNYFDTGSPGWEKDLSAMSEAIRLARHSLAAQVVPTVEILPGAGITSPDAVAQYITDSAWGHHASSTCPIGATGDRMAVLDAKFRVRGTRGLRVVDASVFPRIPGTFTAVSTYLVAEKAAEEILGAVE